MTSRIATNGPDETRYNFYHGIHKALRLGHCRMLAALGANDFTHEDKTKALLSELRGLMILAKSHLEGENREIHAALEQRAPGASAMPPKATRSMSGASPKSNSSSAPWNWRRACGSWRAAGSIIAMRSSPPMTSST